jgi:outer membrane protein OmpA-like peptidoglycan-associated protein
MQEAERLETELADLQAEQTARGIVVTLGNEVLFATDSDELKSGAQRSLDQLADFLQEHPERALLIEGHTDSRGTAAHNADLSERRAESVARALVERGIAAERLRPVGLGEGYPVASNDTDAGRQQNRRVEVVVSGKDGRFPAEARRSVARESG